MGAEAARRDARTRIGVALLLGLVTVAIRLPFLDLPFERDEGEYAYIAWRLSYDEVPYRDWFNQKTPGSFFVYAAALALPLEPEVAVRCVGALASGLTAAALFFLSLQLIGPWAAAGSALLFAWLAAEPRIQGPLVNTELFMGFWIVLAHALFLREVRRSPAAIRAAAVGTCVGLACAFKQVAAVNAIFFALAYPLLVPAEVRLRRSAAFVGWAALGGLGVWLLLLGWFTAHGALGPALDAILLFNLDYTSAIPVARRLANLAATFGQLLGTQGIPWLLALGGIAVLARRPGRWRAGYLTGWAALSGVGVAASGHFFPHYFQQLLPPVAVGAAACAEGLYRWTGWSRWPTRLRRALVGVLLLAQPAVATFVFWPYSPARVTAYIYPDNAFETMRSIAETVAAQSGPDDSVFVFGAEPEILFYAQRRSATRYIHLFPVFGPFSDAVERQREVIEALAREEPAVIIYMPNRLFFVPGSPQDLTRWLNGYLREHYRVHAIVVDGPRTRGRVVPVPGRVPRIPDERAHWGTIWVRDAEAAPPKERPS